MGSDRIGFWSVPVAQWWQRAAKSRIRRAVDAGARQKR
jgi:hypothetical protein